MVISFYWYPQTTNCVVNISLHRVGASPGNNLRHILSSLFREKLSRKGQFYPIFLPSKVAMAVLIYPGTPVLVTEL